MKLKSIFTFVILIFFGCAFGQSSNLQSNLLLKPNPNSSIEPAEMWINESFGNYNQQKEIIEKRDANSKHFKNSDGTITAIISAGNMHYLDGGLMKTIFHTIEETSDGFRTIHNSFKTYYPSTSSGSIRTVLPSGAEFKDLKEMKMYFQIGSAQLEVKNISNSNGSSNLNQLTYPNVYGEGIDLRLTQNTTFRKLDYIINSLDALGTIPNNAEWLVFEEKVQIPKGWIAIIEGNTIKVIDALGQLQFVFEKPIFKDSPAHTHEEELSGSVDHINCSADHSGHELVGNYELVQNGNILTILTKVPMDWMMNESRTYPVIIDPTVNCVPDNTANWTGYHTTTSGSNTYVDGSPNFTSTNITNSVSNLLILGRYDYDKVYNSWIKFNINSVPDDACINSASVNYRISYNYSNDPPNCLVNVRMRNMTTDPSVAFSAPNNTARLADIRDGDIYQTQNLAAGATGTGWRSVGLVSNLFHLTNQLPVNWFAVGMNNYSGGTHTSCYLESYGHSSSDKPYLTVTYVDLSVNFPADLTLCSGSSMVLSPTVVTPVGVCNYSIRLFDTYGDGWHGNNFVNVTVAGVNVVSNGTLGSGSGPANYNFSVSPSQAINVAYTPGSYPAECYYSVYDGANGTGTMIFQSIIGAQPSANQSITNGCSASGPAVTYLWSPATGLSATNIANPTTSLSSSITYTLTATSSGCSASDQITITVTPTALQPTSVSATHPLHPNYCHGNTINLTSVGGTPAGGSVVDVWYENSCNLDVTETWSTTPVGRPGWWLGSTTVNAASGILNVTSTSNDPMIYIGNLSINPNIYRYIQVRYRYVSGPTSSGMQVFFENGSGLAESRSQRGTMIMDGSWNYLNLDMSLNYSNVNSGWIGGGTVTGLRFDFCENTGMVMEFDFFLVSEGRMLSDQATLNIGPANSLYPTISTQYYTRKIDNCGATSCASSNVVLPPLGTTLALNNEAATCYVNANETIRYYHSSGRYIATVTSGATTLGSTIATNYLESAYMIVPACNMTSLDVAVMQRHWVITPTVNGPATVRLPYYTSELSNLGAGSLVSSSNYDLIVSPNNSNVFLSKYSGGTFPTATNVNNNPYDNCTVGGTLLFSNSGIGTSNPVANISAMYSDYVIPGFSEFWLHGNNNNSPLPIELNSFAAICDDLGEKVRVHWSTASENNSSHFTIERSFDALNWEIIGTVGAAGNATSSLNYELTDSDVRGHSIIYYRLNQYDLDGASEIFGPASVECMFSTEGFEVFPNPAESEVVVLLHGEHQVGETNIVFTDINGKEVKRIVYNEQTGKLMNVDLRNFLPGVYIVRLIETNASSQFIRLIIK